MGRGGKDKEDKPLSELTQGWVNYSVAKNKLEIYQSFVNQLFDVVKSQDGVDLLWVNEFPKEIKEENLVHLLNVIKVLLKNK